jgi:acyl-CoA thioesterase YciA
VVTAAVSDLAFIRPVKVGDVVCCYTMLLATGRSSLTYGVDVWAIRRDGSQERVTEARFVMVALDAEGRPRPLVAG